MPDRPPPPRTTTRPNLKAVPREFRALPADASFEQLLHAYQEQSAAYATIAAGYNSEIPAIRGDVAELQVLTEAHGVRIGRLEIWREDALSTPPLPPMRAELGSSNDLTKHASGEIADKVTAVISDTTTPGPDREQVQAISEDVLRVAIARVKQEENSRKWEELEAERKAAEQDRMAMEAKAAQIKAQADADAKAAKERADDDRRKLALENAQAKTRTVWALVLAGFLGAGTVVREVVEYVVHKQEAQRPTPALVAPAPSRPQ